MAATGAVGIVRAVAVAGCVLAGGILRAQGIDGPTLHDDAAAGNAGRVARVLNAGLDVDVRDAQGRTALHVAAAEGQLLVVMMLIAKGADLDARDRRGRTALHAAAAGRDATAGMRFQVVQLLLSEGADPRRRDAEGQLPAECATRPEIAAALRR